VSRRSLWWHTDARLLTFALHPEESPYQFVAMVPQDVTERLLVEELGRKGGAVEYETTFVSPVDQGDYISVTMDRKCEPIKLTTSFVVGCDAHTALLGIY
jgi:2-polyprenyl-6-methoxyphenol hydroxylase-like FAD-dependent oxidoreductase